MEVAHYCCDEEARTESLKLYETLVMFQENYRQKLPRQVNLSAEVILEILREGKPLLAVDVIAIPAEHLAVIAREVVQIVASRGKPEATLPLKQWLKEVAWQNEQGRNVDMVFGAAFYESWGMRAAAVDPEVGAFVVYNILAPFYIQYAQEVTACVDLSGWKQGKCPVCGANPFLAILRSEDGARLLACSFCRTEWSFPRLVCPFCGNNNQRSLGFFYLPEKEAYRVYICQECKHYLKTVVAQNLGRRPLPGVENLVTLFLDEIAQGEGYSSGESFYPLSAGNPETLPGIT